MTKRCANPQCLVSCDAFGAGALYALQKVSTVRSSRRNDFLWLCVSCSARSVLATDADGNVVVLPKTKSLASLRSDGRHNIRLIFASTYVLLPTHTTIWK